MKNGVIALLSPEVAFHQESPNYTGGLGVFTATLNTAANKAGLPMVGVSMLYSDGYYDQVIRDGRMEIEYIDRYQGGDPNGYYQKTGILDDTGVMFTIPINAHPVWIKVLKLSDAAREKYRATPFYFLTTDMPQNDWESRVNSKNPYGGAASRGANMRRLIAWSMILGSGGAEALKRLNVPVSLYHLNESHVGFAAVQLCLNFYRDCGDIEEAIRRTREVTVFTTHTPVKEGNPVYDFDTVCEFFRNGSGVPREFFARLGGNPFNMTAACLRLSRKANAVSMKHLETASKMWAWLGRDLPPLIGITNGTDRDFWQNDEFRRARDQHEVKSAKIFHKRTLCEYVRNLAGREFREDVFTIVWARRFARYKRSKLLFWGKNFPWISDLLRSGRVQVIFAGKPHPNDEKSIADWNEILRFSSEMPNLVILPGYELEMSKILKAGADLWLNTPRSPEEASATSGMSGMMNGALHASTPDGWALEQNRENCFIFGTTLQLPDQDNYDADRLRVSLMHALTMYECDQNGWSEMRFRAVKEAEEHWTGNRMIKQYIEELYEWK